MPADKPAEKRPPRFPPPQFPPHRPKLFATTPPAIFPPILGLMGLVLALRKAASLTGLPGGLVEVLAGAVLAIWAFAVLAIKVKGWSRLSVFLEDMRPIPGRAGMAAASMTGMAAGALIAPYLPGLGVFLALGSVLAHAVLDGYLLLALRGLPAQQRDVNPTLHLSFVGFIVAGPVLASQGWTAAATLIFYPTAVIALLIWAASLLQLIRTTPPAPLRPLLAIHLAPAALLSTTAGLLGLTTAATIFAAIGILILVALLASLRWITASGFSPMWGAFTFPLAAFATALMGQGGFPGQLGLGLCLAALIANPIIAWNILKLWPGNRLAQKTGAAEA